MTGRHTATLYHSFSLVCCEITVDVSDIKYVINFDFPNNTEDYIHRIGRTARAKNVGTAYTFFTSQVQYSSCAYIYAIFIFHCVVHVHVLYSQNARQANELLNILKEANQHISPELLDLAQMAKSTQMEKGKSSEYS